MSVGCALHGRVVEANLAENRSREADRSRAVDLANFNPEIFHPLAGPGRSVVDRLGLVL